MHVSTYIHTYIHIHTYIYIQTCIHTYARNFTEAILFCDYKYIYIYIYIYTYIYIYIYIYIYVIHNNIKTHKLSATNYLLSTASEQIDLILCMTDLPAV